MIRRSKHPKAAQSFDKQGRKGLEETKRNVSKAKDGIQRFREKRAAESIKRQTVRTSGNKTIKAVEQTEKTIKQSASSAGKKTIKTAGKGTAKAAQRSVKTTKTAIKTTQQAAKTAQKTAQATVKASQKAAQAAKAAAKATVAGVKAAVKATIAAVKAIIAATKALVAAIAAGGWVAVAVIVVICLIALICGSVFGIFFSGEDSGTGMSMQTAVQKINADYDAKMEAEKNSVAYDNMEISGGRAVWKDVLAVYAVKTNTDKDNPQEVATMDESKKQLLSDIFWEMNSISSRSESHSETEITETDDGNGNIVQTETTVTKTTLYITVSHLTVDEMADLYGFDAGQREYLAELLKESSTVLEDLYKNVADYVEKLYKNWYLSTLGNQWTTLVRDELSQSSRLLGITNQEDFYRAYVKPIVSAGSRAFVIISDALRYEVAVELTSKLLRETKGAAQISSMQSVFPSVTKFGMAALLPHRELQLTDDIKVLCDGEPTEGTTGRQKILNAVHDGNVAIAYKTLLGMKTAERRELVSNAQVVYIYHNAIDAVGDKAATEDQVFEACDQAVTELKKLVRLIANDMNGTNILITADHGFLYSYKPLDESDKAEKSFVSGHIIELDRRYVIADGDCTADHMLKIPMTHCASDLVGFTPLDNIRMKKQGGGMNYVHGGISLQESVVPVIEYKNMRTSSKKFVDVKKAELQLISQSRKVSNSIFSLDFYQKEAVSGKITAATYEIYMSDASGKAVSDKKTVIADKTSTNGSDRVFRTRFTLKSMDFKKTDTYYLTVVEKGTTNITDRVEFTIDIAFVNDFDF